MNRMQGALLEEAFRLVASGYASIEDIDIGIREGLALRWSFMGPFETIDLNAPGGVRDYVERYEQIYSALPTMQWRAEWSGPVLDEIEAERRKKLPADKLQERQAWRDRRLMSLAAHKREPRRDRAELGVKSRNNEIERQSHHHLRRDGRDPYAFDVAPSAGDAGRDRRGRHRRRGSRRRHHASACARSRRPASPTRRPKPSPASCPASSRRPMRWSI